MLFSLPIKENWKKIEYTNNGVERKFPYCDYEITPLSEWNYGFAGDEFELDFEVEYKDIGCYPFSHKDAPIKIKTQMAKVEWDEKYGVCEIVPKSTKAISNIEDIYLQPYGCTNLRMTEMPLVKQKT